MTHNYRCASAKGSTCRCSCGGGGHGNSRRGIKRKSGSSTLAVGVTKAVATGAALGATAAVLPVIIPVYETYNIAKIGKKVYDAYDKSKSKDEAFNTLMTEVVKYGASKIVSHITEDSASSLAKGIVSAAGATGIISEVSKETGIRKHVFESMLEGSIKNSLISGIEILGEFTVKKITSD